MPDRPIIRITPDGPSHVLLSAKAYLGKDLFTLFRAAIEGATYDPQRKCNRLTHDRLPAVVTKLKAAGFAPVAPIALHALLTATREQAAKDELTAAQRTERLAARLASMGLTLYPFQARGTSWLAPRFSALLADEQGCGKTIQALTALPSGDERKGVLVVCPAVAKGTWLKETRKWRPDLIPSALSGRNSFRWPRPGELLVTNFDILPEESALPGLADEGITLIADEAHKLKNYSAARTKRFRAVREAVVNKKGRCWGLTGTPLMNEPPELWGVLSSLGLAQECFGSFRQFAEMFGPRKTKWGTEWGMPSAEVAVRLPRVMLRRTREEVLPDLPVKTWTTYECDLSRHAACRVRDAAFEAVGQSVEAEVKTLGADELPDFQKFSGTRAALAESKIPALFELLDARDASADPIIVFSAHRAPVAAVVERYGDAWAQITGDTSPEERSRIETDFQAGKYRGLVATIQAVGVALTLTRAHEEIFVDRCWTPADNAQAEDRCCRIGQTNGVLVTDLVARHPLDEHVYAVLMRKQALIDATLKKVSVVTESDTEPAGAPGTERVES